MGHADVAVLDGGVGAWTRAGGALASAAAAPTPGRLAALPRARR